jgi:hypothetical protein
MRAISCLFARSSAIFGPTNDSYGLTIEVCSHGMGRSPRLAFDLAEGSSRSIQ